MIYAEARQAILFRLSNKKIIEVAPLLSQESEGVSGENLTSENQNTTEKSQENNSSSDESKDLLDGDEDSSK